MNNSVVALQACTGKFDDNISPPGEIDQFEQTFLLSHTDFIGSKYFNYPTFPYSRYMKIGIK